MPKTGGVSFVPTTRKLSETLANVHATPIMHHRPCWNLGSGTTPPNCTSALRAIIPPVPCTYGRLLLHVRRVYMANTNHGSRQTHAQTVLAAPILGVPPLSARKNVSIAVRTTDSAIKIPTGILPLFRLRGCSLQGRFDRCTCKAVKVYASPSWVGEIARPGLGWMYLQGLLGRCAVQNIYKHSQHPCQST